MKTRPPHVRTVFSNVAPDLTHGEASWLGDCREEPTLFDDNLDVEGPDKETPTERQRRHEIAVAICLSCPLLGPCERALAAQTETVAGVWAGKVLGRPRMTRAGFVRADEPGERPAKPCGRKECTNVIPASPARTHGPQKTWCSDSCRNHVYRATRRRAA